jgi:cob(I)alamin adenosyltransferase
LFDLGSELATPPAAVYEGMFRIGPDAVRRLEALMDECQKDLQPLSSFILPGGGRVSAFLHLARTVCRRAERDILRLSREEGIGEHVLPYVNRLSDLLFVLSRWIGHHCGETEYLWQRGLRAHTRHGQKSRKKGTSSDG